MTDNARTSRMDQRLSAAERRARVVKLRRGGRTFTEIGQEMGITKQAAHNAYKAALRHLCDEMVEDAKQLRAMECNRLDRLLRAWWSRALDGNERAAEIVLRIHDRRAKLLGIDAPVKVAPTDPTGDRPYEQPPAPATLDGAIAEVLAIAERAGAPAGALSAPGDPPAAH